jgi:hypothetical protein
VKLAACAASVVLAWTAFGLGARADDKPPAAASCSGTIRDVHGKPIAGVAVSVEGGASTKSAADGTWSIAGVSPGEALVTAEIHGRFRVQTLLTVAAGETRRWDATIGTPGHLRGHVFDEYGHPLVGDKSTDRGWMVAASPVPDWVCGPYLRGASPEKWHVLTDADGAFDLWVHPGVLFRLCVSVRAPGPEWWSRALTTEPMTAGLCDVTLRVPPENMPHARIRCCFEDSRGKAVSAAPGTEVALLQSDRHFATHLTIAFDAAKSEWVSNRLAPGEYSVVAGLPSCGTYEFPAVCVRDAADVDLGTLRLPPTGRVRFTPARSGAGSDGVAHAFVRRILSRDGSDALGPILGGWGGRLAADNADDAAVESDCLPGRYVAFVNGTKPSDMRAQNVEIPFEVRSGETTNVTIPLRSPPPRAMTLRYPGARPWQAMVTASDADGIVEARWRLIDEQDFPPELLRLAPGRHAIVVWTSDRRRLTGTLDIPDENAPEKFDVVLR